MASKIDFTKKQNYKFKMKNIQNEKSEERKEDVLNILKRLTGEGLKGEEIIELIRKSF